MPKNINEMTQDELKAELLRLRGQMRDDALKCLREIESARAAFKRKPPETKKELGR